MRRLFIQIIRLYLFKLNYFKHSNSPGDCSGMLKQKSSDDDKIPDQKLCDLLMFESDL